MPITKRDVLINIRTEVSKNALRASTNAINSITAAFTKGNLSIQAYKKANERVAETLRATSAKVRDYTRQIGVEDSKLVDDVNANTHALGSLMRKRISSLSKLGQAALEASTKFHALANAQENAARIGRMQDITRMLAAGGRIRETALPSGFTQLIDERIRRRRAITGIVGSGGTITQTSPSGFQERLARTRQVASRLGRGGVTLQRPNLVGGSPLMTAAMSVLSAPSGIRTGTALGGGPAISPDILSRTPLEPDSVRLRRWRAKQAAAGLGRGGVTLETTPSSGMTFQQAAQLRFLQAGNVIPPGAMAAAGFGAGGRGRQGGGGRGRGGGGGRRDRGFVSGHGFTSAPEFVALAGAGLIGRQVLTEAAEFDKAMAAVAAATHATDAELNRLKETAISLSTESVFSGSEIASGMVLLSRAGLDTNAIITTLEPTLNLATGAGEEFGDVAKGVTDIISQFGLKTEDAGRVSDILAKVLINSKADIKDLIPAFVQGGAVAKALGLSVEETAATFDILATSGLKGTAAGTGLRNVLLGIELIQKREIFEGLGLSAEDVSIKTHGLVKVLDTLKKTNLSSRETIETFNRRGLVPFLTLISQGKTATDTLVESYRNLNNEAKILSSKTTENVTDSLTKLKNIALAPLTEEFQRLKPAIMGIVDAFSGLIQTNVGKEVMVIGGELITLGGIIGTTIISIKGIARMWDMVAASAGRAAIAQGTAGGGAAGGAAVGAGGAAAGAAGGAAAVGLAARIKNFFTVARGPLAGAKPIGPVMSIGLPIVVAHAVHSWVSGEIEDVQKLQDDAEQFSKEGVLSTKLRAALTGRISGAVDIPSQQVLLAEFQSEKAAIAAQRTNPEILALQNRRVETEKKLVDAESELSIQEKLLEDRPTTKGQLSVNEARAKTETLSGEVAQMRQAEQETDVVLITSIRELESAISTLSLSLGESATAPHQRGLSKEERLKAEKAAKVTKRQRDKEAKENEQKAKDEDKKRAAAAKKIKDAKIAADKAAADKIRGIWEGAFNSIEGSVADSFEAMTQSTEKFKASLKTLPDAIKNAMVKAAAQEASSAMMTPIKNAVFSKFGGLFGGAPTGGAPGGNAPGGGGLFGGFSSLFGGGGAAGTASGTGATGSAAGAGGLAGLPMLGILGALVGGAGIGQAIGGKGSKGRTATSRGVGAGGAAIGGTAGFFLGGPLGAAVGAAGGAAAASIIAKGLGIQGGASKKKLRHRRAKAAGALAAQIETERQKERDRAATQLQQVFGGGLVTTEGATEIGQLLSGGISEAELQELEKGAGDTPGALGGAVGSPAVGNNVTMNNQFIIRSGMDVNKIAQALGQQISQFTPAGSFGVP